jgi:cysteine dioxygenase
MRPISIDGFTAGLCSLSEECFSVAGVSDYIKGHYVDAASLRPYLFFSKSQYTRNLIFKNELFELMAVCWDIGQISRIHNHSDQRCWMTMPIGRLRVQNFRVVVQDDKTGYCQLKPTEVFNIQRLSPAKVDPAEPVHQVFNPVEFNERAVSLHIYSKPYNRCLVYSRSKSEYRELTLSYTSEYGKLCAGVIL